MDFEFMSFYQMFFVDIQLQSEDVEDLPNTPSPDTAPTPAIMAPQEAEENEAVAPAPAGPPKQGELSLPLTCVFAFFNLRNEIRLLVIIQ